MKLITTIYDRSEILPHFLKYYKKLGVDEFIIAIHRMETHPEIKFIKKIIHDNNYNCILENYDIGDYFCGIKESIVHNNLKKRYVGETGEWFMVTDIDEFIDFHGKNVHQIINDANENDKLWVNAIMKDRISKKYDIPKKLENDIFKQFPITSDFSQKISGSSNRKVNLMKSSLDIKTGHHWCFEYDMSVLQDWQLPYEDNFIVNHFKWYGNVEKSLKIKEIGNHYHKHFYANEKTKLLKFINENESLKLS